MSFRSDDRIHETRSKASGSLKAKDAGRGIGTVVGAIIGSKYGQTQLGMKMGGEGGERTGKFLESGEFSDFMEAGQVPGLPGDTGGDDKDSGPMEGQPGGKLDGILDNMGKVDKYRSLYDSFAGQGGGMGGGSMGGGGSFYGGGGWGGGA